MARETDWMAKRERQKQILQKARDTAAFPEQAVGKSFIWIYAAFV